MGLDRLFEEGHLKRGSPSPEKAQKSISTAENYLEKARKVFDQGMDDVAVLLAYSSAFHACRAVLFRDGVSERSHAAVAVYLREKHPEIGHDAVETFDLYRKLRHSIAYGFDAKVGPSDSKKAIEFAQSLLAKVKQVLGQK